MKLSVLSPCHMSMNLVTVAVFLLSSVASANTETCAQRAQRAFIGEVPVRQTIYDAFRVSIFPLDKARAWCQQEDGDVIDCAVKYYKLAYFISPDRSLEMCKNEAPETLACATESFRYFKVISFERALQFCRDETDAARACVANASFGQRDFEQVVQSCQNHRRTR